MDRSMENMGNHMERKATRRPQKEDRSFFTKKRGYMDYQILFLVITAFGFGIMMVYSASSYKAVSMGYANYYFALRQAEIGLVGLVGMIFVSRINYRWYKNISRILIFVCIVLQLIALLGITGGESHGASRWIYIGSIGFQPGEIAKIAIAIYTAHICVSDPKNVESLVGLAKSVWPMVILMGLIAVENLSTAVICFIIMVVTIFVACRDLKPLVIMFLIAGVVGVILILTKGYRGARILSFLGKGTEAGDYQNEQALLTIGSGGLFGKGLGQSIQKLGFLPESHNDFIFAIICEELGLFGAICVIALFATLVYRMVYVAFHAPDSFSGLLLTGIIVHISLQAIINICVVTGLIPNTGVPLPFISYGGTSLLFLLCEMGIVLNISRQIKFKVKKTAPGAKG